MASPTSPTFTRVGILVVASLIITWSIASLLPHYTPTIKDHIKTRLSEARQRIPKVKIDWHPSWLNEDLRDQFNSSKVTLLIKSRPLPHLLPLLLHMISVVPPDWRFVFIGKNLSVTSEIDSKVKVHRLLTDIRFYDEFLPDVEWLLKYESDSILCANSATNLNEWLDWDWAGSPSYETVDGRFSGNGGLSLRRVTAIRRILKFQERYNDSHLEDEWFGIRLWVLPGARVAAGEKDQLAVEDHYIPNAIGFHLRDGGHGISDQVWKDPGQREIIFEYCPELSLIMNMKLQRERCPGDNLDGTLQETNG
ncbi:hypothetical protein F5X98DRAFT_367781 [Xylaria grammica]|nr:hypothetical protein F5X98DRAFT_367781 [Xylaria grammica]